MALLEHEIELLDKLTSLNAVASYEDEVRDYLKGCYLKMGYELIYDNLGSIFAYKKSKVKNAPKVMIDGHMDEVGFMVTNFLSNGMIEAISIGGIKKEAVFDEKVTLKTKTGVLYTGVIQREEPVIEQSLPYIIVRIDFGFDTQEDAIKSGIECGDAVYFDTKLYQIAEDVYCCKAIDNRYSLALGIEILEYFKDKELPFDLYVGGSVQEEVGLRGAETITRVIKPDLAIVLDCSRATRDKNVPGHIGEGVLLRIFDPGMVAFKELIEMQKEACEKVNAKYQYFYTAGRTNAAAIHKSENGILTLSHCICALDIHTAKSYFSGSDYQAAKKSLIYMLEHFNNEKLEVLREKRR